MKSAKEWAAETVDERDGALVLHHIGGGRSVSVDVDVDASDLDEVIDDARTVVERLIERAQADARAPLEAELARLQSELARNEALERVLKIKAKAEPVDFNWHLEPNEEKF